MLPKNYLDSQFSQKTPSARISFKRSSIKYKKLNKQALAESFSEIQKNSEHLFFPPNIRASKQLEHDTSLSLQAHKILNSRKMTNKLGSPSGLKFPQTGHSEQSKAKKQMSRNLLQSLSGKYSQNLSSGAAFGPNLAGSGKQNSSFFKNMLFSLVSDPKGHSGAQMALAKRPFDENNAIFNHNESRLFEALHLQYPQPSPYEEEKSSTSHCCLSEQIAPIYSNYVREGPLDLNLNRIGICFLSGEQNIHHFGQYSLVPQGFKVHRRDSVHTTQESSKETLLMKKEHQPEPIQKQMGRIIRLNSGLFVTAAIDINSIKSDISSTESRQFYLGLAPFKFQSGIGSQRGSQKKSQNLEQPRAIETLKREGLNQKNCKHHSTIGEEIGSRMTIKWN